MNTRFLSSSSRPSGRSPFHTAFTIVELLGVITIASILMASTAPLISGALGAGGARHAIGETAGALEYARSSAMRLSTWTWVGVADTTHLSRDGSPQVTLVTLASIDGSNDRSADNLRLISKATHLSRTHIFNAPTETGVYALGSSEGDDGLALQWKLPLGGESTEIDFSGQVIGFSPRGEALVGSSLSHSWIAINFISPTNMNDRHSLLVSGPSGQVIIR